MINPSRAFIVGLQMTIGRYSSILGILGKTLLRGMIRQVK